MRLLTVIARWAIVGLLSILLAACVAKPQQQNTLYNVRGVVVSDAGQLRFKPCFERNWWQLLDASPEQDLARFQQQLTGIGNVPVYMELLAASNPVKESQLLVEELLVAGGTQATCHLDLTGVEFRAASLSPYWVADLNADTVVVKSVNPIGRYSFSVERKILANGDIEYRERKPSLSKPFRMIVSARRCIDPQNGTLVDYSANMKLFGQAYRGCARPGVTVSQSLAGFYWYEDSKSKQGRKAVLMKLHEDERVELVTRQSGAAAVTERGRWQFLESGKLILTMTDRDQKEFLMIFSRQANSSFQLEKGNMAYAQEGAEFRLWQVHSLPGGVAESKAESTNRQAGKILKVLPDVLQTAEKSLEFKTIPATTDDKNIPEIFVTQ